MYIAMDETSGDSHSIHTTDDRKHTRYTVALGIVDVGRVCMLIQIQCFYGNIDLSRSVPLRTDLIASHPHEIVR